LRDSVKKIWRRVFMPNGEEGLEKFPMIGQLSAEIAGILRQISDLKASEAKTRMVAEALRAGEEKLRELVDNLPQRIYAKDQDLAYVFCNESYARDFRMNPEEMVGKKDQDLYPEELAEKYTEVEKRILQTQMTEELEELYVVSGRELTIQSVKKPLRNREGSIIGILSTFWDISERKRVEEERGKYCLSLKELVAQREAQIETLSDQLQRETAQRRETEEEYQRIRNLLEGQLSEVGTELDRVRGELQREVEDRKRAAEALQQTKKQVQTLMVSLNGLISTEPG
jgi:PAS domain S-box-containing protein